MPSNRTFWILIRIAVAEGAIICGLLIYILHLKSVISLRITLPLAILFTLIVGILLNNAEKKHKNTL
jgi:hypothetical protein